MKFGTGTLFHKTLPCGREFHRTRISEYQTLLKTSSAFLTLPSIFRDYFGKYRYSSYPHIADE